MWHIYVGLLLALHGHGLRRYRKYRRSNTCTYAGKQMNHPLSTAEQVIAVIMFGLSAGIIIGIPFTLYLIG